MIQKKFTFKSTKRKRKAARYTTKYCGRKITSKAMLFSSSNRPSAAEPSYADVWEDTESESCGSPLPRAMSFSRRPSSEFNHPKRGTSAITRLVAAERKQFNPKSKPSLLAALLKPSPAVEPLVSPTTTNVPIISPTNRPGTTTISRGLESLRNFQGLGTSAVSLAPISAETQIAEAPLADSTVSDDEDDLFSPSTPPASLLTEPFDPHEYQYDKHYRPSIPDHDHQWYPTRDSQSAYYAFPAYCPRKQEQPQESPIPTSPLLDSITRTDSGISGIPLVEADTIAEGKPNTDTKAVAITGSVPITIPGPATDTAPRPPPLLRSVLPSLTSQSLNMSEVEAKGRPSSRPASTSPKNADPACTGCVTPLTFTLDISYLSDDKIWECCNCAAKNRK